MSLPAFTSSGHCRAGTHCGTCRDREGGRQFRAGLAGAFALPDDAPDFACPVGHGWGYVPPAPPASPRPPGGVGTEVRDLLSAFGFLKPAGCKCNLLAHQWDVLGPDWCAANVPTIAAHLEDAAAKAGHPVQTDDDRQAVATLIAQAIENARANLTPPRKDRPNGR